MSFHFSVTCENISRVTRVSSAQTRANNAQEANSLPAPNRHLNDDLSIHEVGKASAASLGEMVWGRNMDGRKIP